MKFLIVGDFDWEDIERLTESWKKFEDERKRDPDKHVKSILGAHRLTANLTEKTKQTHWNN